MNMSRSTYRSCIKPLDLLAAVSHGDGRDFHQREAACLRMRMAFKPGGQDGGSQFISQVDIYKERGASGQVRDEGIRSLLLSAEARGPAPCLSPAPSCHCEIATGVSMHPKRHRVVCCVSITMESTIRVEVKSTAGECQDSDRNHISPLASSHLQGQNPIIILNISAALIHVLTLLLVHTARRLPASH